jgi:hypothetical protein
MRFQVNRGLSAAKLNQVLEVKWREFQESNPYNQQQEEIIDSSGDESKPVSIAESDEEKADSGVSKYK